MKPIHSLYFTLAIACAIIFSAYTPAQATITVDFTWTGSCLGGPTSFQSNASSTNGAIVAYYWQFGDGTTSVLANPVHVYATAATWGVTLTVTDILGYQGSVTKFVAISPLPVVNFVADTACFGSITTFTDLSLTNGGGPIISWSWNFGDGTPLSTQPNPIHIYGSYGVFTVTLTVVNSNGCAQSVSKNVLVNPLPTAEFSYTTPNCLGSPVCFTDLSTTPGGYIARWFWDFGDGTTQNVIFPANPNVCHTYGGAALSHTVRLTVTTSDSCTHFIEHIVNSIPSPIANFTYSAMTCAGQAVQFTDLTQLNGGGSIISWYWNFGDPASGTNNTSNLQNPSHIFADPGVYYVFLYVTNISGCGDTIFKSVPIETSPVADFTFSNTCAGNPVQFTDDSQPGGGTITSWFWDFGDPGSGASNTSTQSNPIHVYINPGAYTVALSVTNSGNCSDAVTKTVTIGTIPQAAFSYTDPHLNQPVQFTDLTTTSGSPIIQWTWNFGDGNMSYMQNPSHTYTMPGYFLVTLAVQDANGCSDMTSSTLHVLPDSTGNTLNGSVVAGSDTISMAHVWLIQIDSTGYPLSMQDTTPGINNVFVFENVPPGKYFLRAIPTPGSVYSSSYLPTYFESEIYWENATEILLGTPQNPYIITLVEYDSTGGGLFTLNGVLVYGGKSITVAQQEILLLDDLDQPVRCVFTDDNGSFSFVSLPGGFYTLYPVITGYTTIPYTIYLDETTNGISITLTITGQVISGDYHPETGNNGFRVYPNPADQYMVVSSGKKFERIILTDARGRIVIETENPGNPFHIETGSLPAGLYILRVNETSVKIIVQH